MSQATQQQEKIVLKREKFFELEKKAAFLEELLDFVEERYLGFLMEQTEGEKNIPLAEAKKLMALR